MKGLEEPEAPGSTIPLCARHLSRIKATNSKINLCQQADGSLICRDLETMTVIAEG